MANIDTIIKLVRSGIGKLTPYSEINHSKYAQYPWCYIKIEDEEHFQVVINFALNSYRDRHRLLVGVPSNTPEYMKVEYKR